jgi:hypothetical protein
MIVDRRSGPQTLSREPHEKTRRFHRLPEIAYLVDGGARPPTTVVSQRVVLSV